MVKALAQEVVPRTERETAHRTVLALAPHPDDAEYYAGGTLAKFARSGDHVIIVVATDGRCGSFALDSDRLAAVRSDEMRRAAEALGAAPPILLGYPDMQLESLAPGILRREFVAAIRRHRPDVLVAQDPYAEHEPHPDHRAVAWAAYEAVNYSALPLVFPEQIESGLRPHFVAEKYFYGVSPSAANLVVDVSETIDVRVAALCEHRSQVEFLVAGVLQQAELAGIDVESQLGALARDPAALLGWAIRAEASQVGSAAGVSFGEAFRFVRFHPLVESALSGRSATRKSE